MAHPSSFVIILPKQDSSEVDPRDPVIDPMRLPLMMDRQVSLGLSPITGYNVGAVGFGYSRRIFLGINIEFPGVHRSHSIHAVQFLITNLILNSETFLRYLAVSFDGSVFHMPCTHCRFFLEEFHKAPNTKTLITNEYQNEFVNLETLLPNHINYRFSDNYHPIFIHTRNNGLTFLFPDSHTLCIDVDCPNLKCRALVAANKSYAPYSNCPSGVALRDCDGKVYRGWYLESIMSQSSLGPVQEALIDFVARSEGKGFDKIVEVVLVEKKIGRVHQENSARMILENIAHRYYTFNVFHVNQ